MLWNEIIIEINKEDIEKAVIFFDNNGFPTVSIDDPSDILEHKEQVRWDYIDDGLFRRDMNTAFVKAYSDDDSVAEELVKNAEKEGFKAYIAKLEEEDWENGWKKYFKPLKIGANVVVAPAWEEYTPAEGEKVITLDSGMAFGTGSHETTKMCLEFIEKYLRKDDNVLDIGTGSGILAICAGLFGSKDITAVDIDELSVKISKENAALNGMENIITVKQGDLLSAAKGTYRFITANIVADIILMLLPDVGRFMDEESILVVSGIITERENEIIKSAGENGFAIVEIKRDDGWTAIVLKKN